MKKFLLLTIFTILVFELTGCHINLPIIDSENATKSTLIKTPTNPINSFRSTEKRSTSFIPTETPVKTYDVLKLQKLFKQSMNDDIWWYVNPKKYDSFNNNSVTYKLYVREYYEQGYTEYIYIYKSVFINLYQEKIFRETEYGIDFDDTINFESNENLNEINASILRAGYRYITQDTINIEQIKPPTYTIIDNEKQNFVLRVQDYILNYFQSYESKCKIYIPDFNFNKNLHLLYFLVEFDNGQTYVYSILVLKDLFMNKPRYVNDEPDFYINYVDNVKSRAIFNFEYIPK